MVKTCAKTVACVVVLLLGGCWDTSGDDPVGTQARKPVGSPVFLEDLTSLVGHWEKKWSEIRDGQKFERKGTARFELVEHGEALREEGIDDNGLSYVSIWRVMPPAIIHVKVEPVGGTPIELTGGWDPSTRTVSLENSDGGFTATYILESNSKYKFSYESRSADGVVAGDGQGVHPKVDGAR